MATEPFEAGWAGEAIAFVRVFGVDGPDGELRLRAQISPDGMVWCDEGTSFDPIPAASEQTLRFIRLRHFGNWIRLAGEVSGPSTFKAHVYWALKE